MKRRLSIFISSVLFAASAFGSNGNVVNVYNWTEYIPNKVIKEFEQQTRIKVNYTTYSSNEELYSKLEADPDTGYDVVFPSSFFVQRMIQANMLHPLNLSAIPNMKNLNPVLMHRDYDPQNRYSLPYFWGTTGVVINTRYYDPSTINQWSDLWQARFKDQILLTDEMRDVFSFALASVSLPINTQDPEQIKAGYLRLLQLLPNVRVFSYDGDIPIMVDADATVGIVENGDAMRMMRSNPSITYKLPKGEVILWTDCMVIPARAPHLSNAYKFINFLMEPKVAKQIALAYMYSTANLTAQKMLPQKIQDNPAMYPPADLIRRAQMQAYLPPEVLAVYMRYWELLKLAA